MKHSDHDGKVNGSSDDSGLVGRVKSLFAYLSISVFWAFFNGSDQRGVVIKRSKDRYSRTSSSSRTVRLSSQFFRSSSSNSSRFTKLKSVLLGLCSANEWCECLRLRERKRPRLFFRRSSCHRSLSNSPSPFPGIAPLSLAVLTCLSHS